MKYKQYSQAAEIEEIVKSASSIVIVQADNPDGDSLGSALALEHILGELGKQTSLYCAVDMPSYLRYLQGWDRVQKELPPNFDASIIVDASTMTLFERLQTSGEHGRLASKPCIILDHHEVVENGVPFATVLINDGGRASAGELIYIISRQLKWPLPLAAQACIMTSILGDTQGLTNELASADTYRIMAEMIDNGVSRPQLEELRREFGKMPVEILRYKGQLIKKTRFSDDGTLAHVAIPQVEINRYSPLYNPAPLIQNDLLQTAGVLVAIVFKHYDDGRVTAAIRCNNPAPIAARLAEHLGGGGHTYASGFKVTDGRSFEAIREDCLSYAVTLLATLNQDKSDETPQYAYTTG